MRRALLSYGGLLILSVSASCQTPIAPQDGPPPEYEPARPKETADAPVPAVPIHPSPTVEPAPQPAAAPAPEPEGPTSCPSNMVLVEGEYCTKVQHTCLVEWYAPQNKKRVCEQFAEKVKCIGKKVTKRYCIDKFAWPNIEGERPEVMNNFYQAQVKCAAAGKRMCSESEWNFACEGPKFKPFPHGYTRDPKKCNGDHKWDSPNMKRVAKRDGRELARLWRGVPSGSQPECVSDFGVHDMPANNDEVVAGESHKAKFASVNTGGPWYSGVRNQCRPKIYTHEEGFYYYFLGFRCCANPDGEDNDIRTKLQKQKGWKQSNIERLASVTVEQMKTTLEHKKYGTCNCVGRGIPASKRTAAVKFRGPSHICKTMCGTLLDGTAKDGDDSTRVPHRSRKKID